MVNERRGPIVEVECICAYRSISGERRGRVNCVLCSGTAIQVKKSCADCGGTGKLGKNCPSCKGVGFRDLDNERF